MLRFNAQSYQEIDERDLVSELEENEMKSLFDALYFEASNETVIDFIVSHLELISTDTLQDEIDSRS